MKDQHKTKPTRPTNGPETIEQQLTAELAELRQRVAELEASEAERGQAEATLQESEERFSGLFEGLPVGLFQHAKGRFLDVNPAMVDITGYPDRETLLVADSAGLFVDLEDHARWRALLMREEGTVHGFEVQLRRYDGTVTWVQLSARAIKDDEGHLLYYEGTLEDIAERKRAEAGQREALAAKEEALTAKENALAKTLQATHTLRESEERFRDLYENAPNAYFSVGADGHIIRCNKRASELLGYAVEEMIGRSVFELYADTPQGKEKASRVFQQFQAGEAVVDEEIQMQKADGTPVWVSLTVNAIRGAQGQVVESRSMVVDITERVKAEVARRQAEEALRLYADRLKILREIDQGILAAQSPEAIAQAAVTQVRQLTPCQRVGIAVLDSEANEMVTLTTDGIYAGETRVKEGARWRLDGLEDVVAAWRQGRTVKWEAFQSPSETGRMLYAEGLRSIVSVPLVSQGELIGSLNLANTDSDTFTQEYEDLARQVADQLAIAIQQAHLYEQVQRHAEELEQRVADRTRELAVLYEVAALASQSLDLETMLARSLQQVLKALNSDAGGIHLFDEASGAPEAQVLRLAVQQGFSPDLTTRIESLPSDEGLGGWLLRHDEPLFVPNITSEPRLVVTLPTEPFAYVGMPLRAGGRTLGVLSIIRGMDQPELSVEELSLLTSTADQLGTVVESARLRKRAERAAVLEERERLARELHDSVTQSLYSLTLFAEWGRDLLEDGELEDAKQRIVRIGETAQQTLKEMRLLVYELRPSLLEQDGLLGALQRRLDAVEKRAGVEVSLQAEPLGKLPASVEIGLYRIAQEALNNALKHAAASSVTVRVEVDGERVAVEVEDDGVGFAPDAMGHTEGLGLVSMRGRAEKIGGTLTIVSRPGEGTTVRVVVG